MSERMTIAAISGSLRRGSWNTAALRSLANMAPKTIEIEILTLHGTELFNEDVEAEGWPPFILELRKAVERSNAVLIASPEYNYSLTGVLKNALDWLSRPTGKGPLYGKPLGILGASPSKVGTARSQAHLRQVAFYNAMPLLPSAEVLISDAGSKFDEQGSLVDDQTTKFLQEFLEDFCQWAEAHASSA